AWLIAHQDPFSLLKRHAKAPLLSETRRRVQREQVRGCAKPRDRSLRCGPDEALVTKRFTRMRVRQVNLDYRHSDRLYGVMERNRRVRETSWIHDHGLDPARIGLVQPIDKMAFMVGLPHVDRQALVPCT